VNSTQHSAVTPILFFGMDEFQLRAVIGDNGEPLFIGADVCQALEIGNVTNALKRLDDDEQALYSIKGLNRGNDLVNVVTEPGLYSLILGSSKPQAKRFKRWVTHEVLPSIRKTGSYSTKSDIQLDRKKRFCRTLMVDISKCEDPFGRDGLVQLAESAFPEIGLTAPSRALLRPLQMPIGWEGGAA
jgi:prophage antirepressor-like protein